MKPIKFSDLLKESLLTIGRAPMIWLGYCVFMGVVFVFGRISLALGIFVAVSCLFVGVGIAKYIDLKSSGNKIPGIFWAINKSLPLAILAAITIMLLWFVFLTVSAVLSNHYDTIWLFFFNWELTEENLALKTTRELANWLFGYANVALVFALLMLTTFLSWFTHSLMLFQDLSLTKAKEKGSKASAKNQNAVYKLMGFIIVQAILCSSITPLLTPFLYMLTSSLLYVSYKRIFETTSEIS
jgi:hypothetical protein